jgi:hypothetical protein
MAQPSALCAPGERTQQDLHGCLSLRAAHARFIRIRPRGAIPYPTALAIRDTQAVMERTVWLAGAESTRTSAARARAYCAPMANTVPTRARRRIGLAQVAP